MKISSDLKAFNECEILETWWANKSRKARMKKTTPSAATRSCFLGWSKNSISQTYKPPNHNMNIDKRIYVAFDCMFVSCPPPRYVSISSLKISPKTNTLSFSEDCHLLHKSSGQRRQRLCQKNWPVVSMPQCDQSQREYDLERCRNNKDSRLQSCEGFTA